MNAGWQDSQVARAQWIVVEKELKDPMRVGPFAAFIKVMQSLPLKPGQRFLDIGCGVGHYGVLLRRYFPDLVYTGLDSSEAMLTHARQLVPSGQFEQCNATAAKWWDYDIVLVSQVLEFLDDPWEQLLRMVTGIAAMRRLEQPHPSYLILHRMRVAEGNSGRTPVEPTYCGYSAQNYEWSMSDVARLLGGFGMKIICSEPWGKNITLAVETR